MALQNLTKLLGIWCWGSSIIIILNFFYHFSEVFLMPAFSIIMFYFIYKELTKHRKLKKYPKLLVKITPFLILLSLVWFYIGLGMHGAANHIAYYLAGEISIASEYAYFYDEILSHTVMYIGLFGLLLGGSLIQSRRPFRLKLDFEDLIVLLVASTIYGIGIALSLIEGQTAFLGIAALILIPAISIHHVDEKNLKIIVKKYPFNFFVVLMLLAMLLILVLYFFTFNGFPQLSEMINFWDYQFVFS